MPNLWLRRREAYSFYVRHGKLKLWRGWKLLRSLRGWLKDRLEAVRLYFAGQVV